MGVRNQKNRLSVTEKILSFIDSNFTNNPQRLYVGLLSNKDEDRVRTVWRHTEDDRNIISPILQNRS